MSDLAAGGIPITVSCRVLQVARQPYYRWRRIPFKGAEQHRAERMNALIDAHSEEPEFGYRYLRDEAAHTGKRMCRRTAWSLVNAAGLNSAVARRGAEVAGCILHADRGSQFRSRKMGSTLARHRMVGSMGKVASAGDNAAMESFWALLQKNVLNRQSWATRQDLRLAIVTWIERTYHRRRAQDRLGGLTPIEYENRLDTAQALAA